MVKVLIGLLGQLQMNNDIKDFWNERASLGTNSGSDDFLIKELEQKAVMPHFAGKDKVLEIGCGNADTAIMIARNYGCSIVATDFSEKMIGLAQANLNDPRNADIKHLITLHCGSVTDTTFIKTLGKFDTVFSQRALINLPSAEEQALAIQNIESVLKLNGIYLMNENCQQGLDKINNLRVLLDLPEISSPWHNRYFNESEIDRYAHEHFKLISSESFASTYYFLSRVVNAALSNQENKQPAYDAPVNLLARQLPGLFEGMGQSRLWIFQKS